MAQWGKTDTAADTPNYVADADANNIYYVDETEAQVALNRAKGLKTPGWVRYITYTDAKGATRHKSEVLVALKETAVNAGDAGVQGNTAIEDSVVADS